MGVIAPLRTRDLRDRIEILRLGGRRIAGGAASWTVVASVLARVEACRPDETRRIRLRYRRDILPTDRLRYAGQDLAIADILDPDGRHQQLWIIARACD